MGSCNNTVETATQLCHIKSTLKLEPVLHEGEGFSPAQGRGIRFTSKHCLAVCFRIMAIALEFGHMKMLHQGGNCSTANNQWVILMKSVMALTATAIYLELELLS